MRRIARQGGIHLIGIPKTIDNDVGATEVSIGFDTATNIATEALIASILPPLVITG
ncbi:MAG UNVERIFIED_CONTAM: 6-phosphofructokinase [Microcystis novacekii LVE1205-3]